MEGSEDSWLVQVCLEVVQTCEARLMLVRVVVVMVQEERNCQIVVMADKWELVNGRRLQMPVEVLENADVRVVVVGGG